MLKSENVNQKNIERNTLKNIKNTETSIKKKSTNGIYNIQKNTKRQEKAKEVQRKEEHKTCYADTEETIEIAIWVSAQSHPIG